jgi:signal recognition particle receptor subunit beta
MPVVNALAREVVFKIVYYGPGLGGKTTSLQHVHATTKAEHRGKMVSLATPVDRTLYFDFLPIRVPNLKDLTVRLQLFTVPGQVYYNATRKLVLTGADGVVLVADSQRARSEANLESLRNLHENLEEQGRRLDETPHILQYNKRDLPDLISIEELEQRLNPHAAPSFASVATVGEGVYEALEAITRAVLEDFENRMPEHRDLIMGQLTVPEGGLADALRQADVDVTDTRPKPILHLDFSGASGTNDVPVALQSRS